MVKLMAYVSLGLGLVASSVAFAGERTVTLAVKNMYCADCPFIVKKSLEGVPGVTKAVVSFKDKTAIVTFDDAKADVGALNKCHDERRLPVNAEKLIATEAGKNDPAIHPYLPELRHIQKRADADRRVPVLLCVYGLRHAAQTQGGRLLRILFLWRRSVSSDPRGAP